MSEDKHLTAFIPPELPTDGLSQLQVNFVDQLIIHKGNQTLAYLAAGYKVKSKEAAAVAASRLIRNVKVRKLLSFRLAQLREAQMIEVHQKRVIQELNRIAFSSPLDVAEWDSDGNVRVKGSDEMTHHELATIKKIKCTKTVKTSKDGTEYETTVLEIEQHDKKGALDILAKASKLVDNSKATVPVSISLNFSGDNDGKRTEKAVN